MKKVLLFVVTVALTSTVILADPIKGDKKGTKGGNPTILNPITGLYEYDCSDIGAEGLPECDTPHQLKCCWKHNPYISTKGNKGINNPNGKGTRGGSGPNGIYYCTDPGAENMPRCTDPAQTDKKCCIFVYTKGGAKSKPTETTPSRIKPTSSKNTVKVPVKTNTANKK